MLLLFYIDTELHDSKEGKNWAESVWETGTEESIYN
jgi:hypothetical protein